MGLIETKITKVPGARSRARLELPGGEADHKQLMRLLDELIVPLLVEEFLQTRLQIAPVSIKTEER